MSSSVEGFPIFVYVVTLRIVCMYSAANLRFFRNVDVRCEYDGSLTDVGFQTNRSSWMTTSALIAYLRG